MKLLRLWAHSRQLLSLIGMMVVGMSVAYPTGAQETKEPQLWEYPGMRPFAGTPLEACQLHKKTTGLPVAECLNGTKLHELGMCEKDYFLQDGVRLHTTYTKGGVSRSVYVQVAFKYPKGHKNAGQPLPVDDVKRYASRCSLNREDGATVLYPYVCGNWSVGKEVILPPPVVVETLEPVPYVPPTVVQYTGVVGSIDVQYNPGFTLESCCNCNTTTFSVPSSFTVVGDGDGLQSSGASVVDR